MIETIFTPLRGLRDLRGSKEQMVAERSIAMHTEHSYVERSTTPAYHGGA
jgi:hypothetical protein